jgi:hypothetical protein
LHFSVELYKPLGVNDRIFEKRPSAADVGITFDEEHAFTLADLSNRIAYGLQRWRRLIGKEALQVGVFDLGWGAALERIGHLQHDEPIAMGSIENAGAIGEAAVSVAKDADLSAHTFEGGYDDDGVGHLLPIRSDILYRSSAHRSGDAAQALYARAIRGYGGCDETVPSFSSPDLEDDPRVFSAL